MITATSALNAFITICMMCTKEWVTRSMHILWGTIQYIPTEHTVPLYPGAVLQSQVFRCAHVPPFSQAGVQIAVYETIMYMKSLGLWR